MADQQYRRRLGEAEMNKGIGMHQAGFSRWHVANVPGVSKSVVYGFGNRFLTTGNVSHFHAGGRERVPLTRLHVQRPIEWARNQVNWTQNDLIPSSFHRRVQILHRLHGQT